MTAKPNELTACINHERLQAFKLARSYSADRMRIVQSGSEREDLLKAA